MQAIRHDAFGRYEIVKEHVNGQTCSECGGKDGRGKVYRYGVRADGSGRVNWSTGKFCGVSCYRAYHS